MSRYEHFLNMAIIVQKYGGTSVANTERIRAVAERGVASAKEGNKVVVVVSAMAGETDKFVQFANEITDSPSEREMDLLLSSGERITSALMAMAIHELGYGSMSFTGRQVGIITDSSHTKAMIERIEGGRLKSALDENKIPVVAGFQGIDESQESKPYCAIKQFWVQSGSPSIEKAAELFSQEAKRLEVLGTIPNIPALQDYFVEAKDQYLIQEFIRGRNLSPRLNIF